MDLPVGDYEAMEKLLAAEEKQGDRNAWKTKEWSRAEDCGWNNWEKASLTYYRFGRSSYHPQQYCSRDALKSQEGSNIGALHYLIMSLLARLRADVHLTMATRNVAATTHQFRKATSQTSGLWPWACQG